MLGALINITVSVLNVAGKVQIKTHLKGASVRKQPSQTIFRMSLESCRPLERSAEMVTQNADAVVSYEGYLLLLHLGPNSWPAASMGTVPELLAKV